jgi:hypothetical protein
MNRGSWLGLVLGLVIGAAYGVWQARELRRRAEQSQPLRWLAGPMIRLASLVVVLLAVVRFTEADKYWLTGSLAVAYTAPLLWALKTTIFRKK